MIRWGIVGTANIARAQFLPGLREAGGGRPALVASRDPRRAEEFAADHGVDRGVVGYASVVESDDIDAVYVAVPNTLHAEWTTRALRAGKAAVEHPTTDERSFTAALRHIHAVLREQAAPEHLAGQSALATAVTLEALRAACGL